MNSYIRISTLNDFVFCPKSIYFHELYQQYDKEVYQDVAQTAGTNAHTAIDTQKYSTAKDILQGVPVFSERFGLIGKIDLYNKKKKLLTERKKKIKKVYQGYIWQVWAQYFCLEEMGHQVESIQLYSLDDNKSHSVELPDKRGEEKFIALLQKYRKFNPEDPFFWQNPNKCEKCIYRELCDYYQG